MNTTTNTDPRDLLTVLRAAGRVGIAACLWGLPGTGKTSLVRALAAADDTPCEVVVGSTQEPTDFGGLPLVGDSASGYTLAPPPWATRLAAQDRGLLFLDELTTAPPAVQAAMLGVILDRKVGDLRLPSAVQVITAANPPEVAAGGWELTAPMANRLLHIDYHPSAEDWISGMINDFALPAPRWVGEPTKVARARSRANVAAFISTRRDLLHALPTNAADLGRAWPSGRTWTMAADLLAVLDPDDTSARMLATTGLVGEGAALEFATWVRTGDLPDPQDVITDPSTVAWATLDPSRAFAVIAAVVAYATGLGTQDSWRSGWGPLAAAADAGLADVGALGARTLLAARPTNARPPKAARAFTSILTAAGLIGGESK